MSLLNVDFDVNQAIKDAEAALGKYGPAIYRAALHQVAAQAGINLVLGIVYTSAMIFCLIIFLISLKKGDWDGGNGWVGAGIAGAIGTAGFLIAGVIVWLTFYQYSAAPDWAALQLLKP